MEYSQYEKTTSAATPDLSKVKNMSHMFLNCQKFHRRRLCTVSTPCGRWQCTNSPIEHWDVSAVKDMLGMLSHALMFNQSLVKMDLRAVEDVDGMLENTHAFDQDLRDLNIGSKVNTNHLFGYKKSLADYKRSGCCDRREPWQGQRRRCKHNEKYAAQDEKKEILQVFN